MIVNKAKLRDLIAATGLVILLKLGSNHRFFARMILKFDGWPRKTTGHLSYMLRWQFLCHQLVNSDLRYFPKTPNSGQNQRFFFFVPCDLENWQMTLKTIRHLFHAISGFVHHFIVISEWQLHLPVRKRPIRVGIVDFFVPCDLKISWMTLKNDRTTLLCYIKLCASYRSNRSI